MREYVYIQFIPISKRFEDAYENSCIMYHTRLRQFGTSHFSISHEQVFFLEHLSIYGIYRCYDDTVRFLINLKILHQVYRYERLLCIPHYLWSVFIRSFNCSMTTIIYWKIIMYVNIGHIYCFVGYTEVFECMAAR